VETLTLKLAFSLAVGFLIGLEREYRMKEDIFAGIRTFPLISLLGTLSAYIYDNYWRGIFFLTFGGVLTLTLMNFYFSAKEHRGITTEITALLTFILGIMVYMGMYYEAGALSITITLILALKETLEGFVHRLSEEDIRNILKFIAITALIFPLLPDRYYGPFDAFNPREIWKMVIIVSSIDFLAYILLRWKGHRYIWLWGAIGGLMSSTAVSFNFARMSRKYPSLRDSLIAGIILAWLVMNIRVLVLTGIVNPPIALKLLLPMLLLSIIYSAGVAFYLKKHLTAQQAATFNFSNPFHIRNALQFGAIYMVVVFAARLLSHYLGEKGIYLASFLSGIIDVDAITLSLSQMSRSTLALETATAGILIAVLSNAFFKYMYVAIFGDKGLRKALLVILITTALVVAGFI